MREFAISYLRQWIFNKQYQACPGEEVLKALKDLKRKVSLEWISEKARRKLCFQVVGEAHRGEQARVR
ncbi:MAG: hypothetical protein ACTSXC_06875 [Candidatus Freyarchaeota archaeon]